MGEQEGRRKIVAYIVLALGIVNIFFIGILINKARIGVKDGNSSVNTTLPTTPIIYMTEDSILKNEKEYTLLNMGKRKKNTVEEIQLKANPPNNDDSLVVLKWVLDYGIVKDFKSEHTVLGTCKDGLKFNKNKLCVDVSKPTPFKQGDIIGTVTIEWSDNGTIFRSPEDGYFNGKKLSPGSYQ